MLCTATAHAQWVVVDPTNLVQNTLTAIRTMEQINNQIQQLQNEADMLINQARNLANLDFNIVNRLRSTLATTERLIAEAQGLAYDVQNLDSDFARLYPEQYAATISGDQMFRDARERWKNSLDGLHTAMRMQAQVSQNLAQDEGALADLVSQSQSATGALQAMQATNQLRLAGQAVHPGPAAPDHARPGRLAGTGAAGGGHRARPRSAAALSRHRHAVHAAVRQLLQQLTGAAMRCVPVLLAVLLTACGQQPAEDLAATLAADPVRLKALRAQCAADRHAAGEDICRAAAEAFRRRFFAGQTGPDEYGSLADLPPIPASFDEPTTEDAP